MVLAVGRWWRRPLADLQALAYPSYVRYVVMMLSARIKLRCTMLIYVDVLDNLN